MMMMMVVLVLVLVVIVVIMVLVTKVMSTTVKEWGDTERYLVVLVW